MAYKRFEYKEFIEKPLGTERFNAVEYLNTLGAEGWEVVGQPAQFYEKSGVKATDGQEIPRYVFAVLAKREIIGDPEIAVSTAVQLDGQQVAESTTPLLRAA